MTQLEDDSCAIVKYGYDSDTEQKAEELGHTFIDILFKYNALPKDIDVDSILRSKIITLVIDRFDLPCNHGLLELMDQFEFRPISQNLE